MHLDIFDFDDTLCISNASIGVTNRKTGGLSRIAARDWGTHQRDDELNDYDMSQFEGLSDQHEPNWEILNIAKETYKNEGANGLRILTARHDDVGVKEFLDLHNMPDVEVYAIGADADKPPGKAGYIENWINELDLTSVRYFDDAQEHIQGARKLAKKYPNVKFEIHQINL